MNAALLRESPLYGFLRFARIVVVGVVLAPSVLLTGCTKPVDTATDYLSHADAALAGGRPGEADQYAQAALHNARRAKPAIDVAPYEDAVQKAKRAVKQAEEERLAKEAVDIREQLTSSRTLASEGTWEKALAAHAAAARAAGRREEPGLIEEARQTRADLPALWARHQASRSSELVASGDRKAREGRAVEAVRDLREARSLLREPAEYLDVKKEERELERRLAQAALKDAAVVVDLEDLFRAQDEALVAIQRFRAGNVGRGDTRAAAEAVESHTGRISLEIGERQDVALATAYRKVMDAYRKASDLAWSGQSLLYGVDRSGLRAARTDTVSAASARIGGRRGAEAHVTTAARASGAGDPLDGAVELRQRP